MGAPAGIGTSKIPSISHSEFVFCVFRISVVFRVRSAQRIKISDADLIKRLVIIVMLFAAYLSVRMVVGRPRVVKGTTSSDLLTTLMWGH